MVIETKEGGKNRISVDYKVLKKRMKGDHLPIPKIQETFDYLERPKVFSTLELFSGYWKVRISEKFWEEMELVCSFGKFKFEVMHFDMMNAPSTFQHMMDQILASLGLIRLCRVDVMVF